MVGIVKPSVKLWTNSNRKKCMLSTMINERKTNTEESNGIRRKKQFNYP